MATKKKSNSKNTHTKIEKIKPVKDRRHREGVQESLEERLRIERFLSKLSAEFISLPASEIDDKIVYWLQKLVELLDVDSSAIAELRPDGKSFQITHFYRVPGYPDPPIQSSDLIPWYTEKLATGELLVLERLPDDLPDNVPLDHINQMKYVKSHVGIPLWVGKRPLGSLGFSSFRKRFSWSDELLQRFKLLGELFANAIERKRAEETLRRSEEQLRIMANSLPALISYVDNHKYYKFANIAYRKMYGNVDETLEGLSLHEVLGGKTYKAISRYIERVLQGEEVSYETEVISKENGMVRQIEASYVPHRDTSGEVIGFFALEHDVTNRKKVEQEAQQHRDQLAHVARVATMDEISTSLAHELNQPLSAIMSNAQAAQRFLAMAPPDIDEVREALSDIVKDDQRASEIIRRLRAMVKKGDHEKSYFNMNDVIIEIMKLVQSDATRIKVEIIPELSQEMPIVLGDRIQIQQVVLNLMLNGFTAMSNSKTGSSQILVSTEKDNEKTIIISVKDSGVGMNEEIMDHMFEAFFTTRPDGLGMGLSISRSIVEAHGGRIWATKNPGCGITVSFTLPVQQEV